MISGVKTSSIIRTIYIESVNFCPNNNKLPARFKNITFKNLPGRVVLSIQINVTETLKAPLEYSAHGERCDMQKTNCIKKNSPPSSDFCPVWNTIYGQFKEVQLWASKVKPPVTKCPIQKNFYEVTDLEVDYRNIINLIPIRDGRFNFKYEIFDRKNGNRRLAACFLVSSKVQMSSSRQRSKN
uniref:CSON005529 protein n=1 Tax=Culicoides sonorensis TaxID=179676 RepID=A0A336KKC7_CULSO